MQTEKFRVKNVKCGGCVSTIRQGLLTVAGVTAVDVVIQGGEVTVDRLFLRPSIDNIGEF